MYRVELIVSFTSFLKVIVENPDNPDDAIGRAVTIPVSVRINSGEADATIGDFRTLRR
jgi:hypothetical protein